jgi:hypothetical protein
MQSNCPKSPREKDKIHEINRGPGAELLDKIHTFLGSSEIAFAN